MEQATVTKGIGMSKITRMTEKELSEHHKENFLLVDALLDTSSLTLSELDEFMPGHFHINCKKTLVLRHMGESGCKYLGKTSEELVAMGEKFLEIYIHPDAQNYDHPKLLEFSQYAYPGSVYSYFEQVRADPEVDKYDWFLNVCKISDKCDGVMYNSIPVKYIQLFAQNFAKVLDDNLFVRKHYSQFASLTKRELEIVKLIAIGKRRKKIAESLCISPHTLDTHRKNVRRKLGLNSFSEIIKYAQALGVI